ncbi:hypothetical protein CHS0354_026960 [Potamilus streckersoni]|uniref:Bardet-Biedl syndrome 10 protein n=1 Tax=Potamilus streckersoni TaxID=2493646 RepID=A0AAE0VTB8_9BIVA|nr:hypothetical protein CHS0354_026960 [Potamilus streckersoni]
MEGLSKIDIELLVHVTSSLQRTVARFYGPQCRQTLMTSDSGRVIVTSDGRTMLDGLHVSHPIAKMIVQASNNCHQYTADGSKTFLLYLAKLCQTLDTYTHLGKLNVQLSFGDKSRSTSNQVSHSLLEVRKKQLPSVMRQILRQSLIWMDNFKDKRQILRNVAVTTLSTHFSQNMSRFFADKLLHLLPETPSEELLPSFIQDMVQKFSKVHIKVPNQPYSNSMVHKAFLLRRDFALQCHENSDGLIKILILCNTVDGVTTESEPSEVFQLHSENQIKDNAEHRRKSVEYFVRKCAECNIKVLICSEKVPDFAHSVFRDYTISVIHCVLKEDIEFLEHISNKCSIHYFTEDIHSQNIFTARKCETVLIGGQKFIHIALETETPINHIIVCAPTEGLCDQTTLYLYQALKSFEKCFDIREIIHSFQLPLEQSMIKAGDMGLYIENDDASNKIPDKKFVTKCPTLVIPGGGVFETLVGIHFQNISKTTEGTSVSILSKIISESAFNIVRVLHQNTHTVLSSEKRQYLEKSTEIINKIQKGELVGLNRRGGICDPLAKGIFEPLVSKVHVLSCVIETLYQLLRIDRIVSIRRTSDLALCTSSNDNSDDE